MSAILKAVETTRYNIDTAALLMEISIGTWTARKLDRGVTDELVHNKSAASKDAARVNKHLLAGRPELENINKFGAAVRQFGYLKTLPWSDSGIRLLPVVHFLTVDGRIKHDETQFWDMVSEFEAIYPTLITAQAMALGDMFNRNDYPDPSAIRSKFSFRVSYMPVPTAGDFRIDVGNAAEKELKQRLEQVTSERIDVMMDDVKQRLKDHLLRMSDRLGVDNVDGEVKSRMFKDTLLDGAFELVELVQGLNVTRDPQIEAVRRGLERAIAGLTVVDLRKNPDIRKDVKKDVDALLAKFAF